MELRSSNNQRQQQRNSNSGIRSLSTHRSTASTNGQSSLTSGRASDADCKTTAGTTMTATTMTMSEFCSSARWRAISACPLARPLVDERFPLVRIDQQQLGVNRLLVRCPAKKEEQNTVVSNSKGSIKTATAEAKQRERGAAAAVAKQRQRNGNSGSETATAAPAIGPSITTSILRQIDPQVLRFLLTSDFRLLFVRGSKRPNNRTYPQQSFNYDVTTFRFYDVLRGIFFSITTYFPPLFR